ncbi:mucin related 18B [Musca autumnalis]|uniref:mucin related 18B n=1 Tax=Musca autumnalis TaxID=221902 RepID=UPI003CE93A78
MCWVYKMPSNCGLAPSNTTTLETNTTMVEAKKLALILIGIYVVILANIGIVNGNVVTTTLDPLVSDADAVVTTEVAWNEDVTDVNPGDVNTAESVVTTTAPGAEDVTDENPGDVNTAEPEVTTTTSEGVTECVCDCSAQGRECDNNTASPNADVPAATTEASGQNGSPTNVPNEGTDTTTSSSSSSSSSTTQEVTTTTSTTAPPPPPCNTPGVEADPSDCRLYHDCTATGSADGSFHLLTKFCASNEAFNAKLRRCSRDISSCPNEVICQVKGGVADPASNTSYYLCEPRLIGGGFHVFHVQCSANQIFYPLLGKCYLDLENLPAAPVYPGFPPYYWNPFEDIDIVKAELKLIKEQDKLTLKLEKELLKAEKKRQKELQKEAEQKAKLEEKLKKELLKQESSTFVCPQDGNYPSTVSETAYFVCVSKKGKSKVTVVQCPVGSKFSSDVGFCVIDNTLLNQALNNSSLEDDDDDED